MIDTRRNSLIAGGIQHSRWARMFANGWKVPASFPTFFFFQLPIGIRVSNEPNTLPPSLLRQDIAAFISIPTWDENLEAPT